MRGNMKTTKVIIWLETVLLIFCVHYLLLGVSHACWGGRPLAMGGAFTGVADNVDAVYWNPAGLAQLQTFSINSTSVSNWHDSNYDIYFAAAGPVKHGGFGFAYVYNKDHLVRLLFESGGKFGWFCQDWNYFQFGYGTYLIKDWNLAIGAIGKLIYSKFEIDKDHEAIYGGDEKITDDTLFDLDFGILGSFGPNVGKHKMFSIGCLAQDVLESEFKFLIEGEELVQKYVLNIRPGLSFRPDEMSIISLEIYDAATQFFDEPQIRIGVEKWFSLGKMRKKLSLRAGGYHINEEDMRAFTAGFSWKFQGGTELGYTIMYWDNYGEETHLLTLNSQF
jgi:hypothetical protein